MPIAEADPWRLQFFAHAACPADLFIPTEDADAWNWQPLHRGIYNKLELALSQGLAAGPHGTSPPRFPVFSKPVINLKGMGEGSRLIATPEDYARHYQPGHMWMVLLTGEHVSTDCALENGVPRWWRHATGRVFRDGMFDYWTIHAAARPALEAYLAGWAARHLKGYTGMANFESIDGRIIEAHLRFADQWPDCYGPGFVEALVRLYAGDGWTLAARPRRNGYSVALFGRHGQRYRHPDAGQQARIRAMPGVASLQITFHADRPPAGHAMPPGGFRLGIVNGFDLPQALAARQALARCFPPEAILWPQA